MNQFGKLSPSQGHKDSHANETKNNESSLAIVIGFLVIVALVFIGLQ
jgi:hypothetical protein